MTHPIRRLLAATAVTVGAVMLPVVAFAATDTEADSEITPVGPDAQQADSAFLDLSPFVVSTILGVLIPLITGILTKVTTPAWVKAVGTIILSGIAGLINVSLVDGGGDRKSVV